jgi:hypothetical protein
MAPPIIASGCLALWLAGAGALSVRPHAAARAQLLSTSPLPRLSVPVAALSAPFQLPPSRPRPRAVCAAAAAEAEAEPRVARLRDRLWSVGWTSWWTQTILSVVSGVLLLFANSVMQRPSPALVGGIVLALAGLGTAFCSIFWTWGFTRLSVRLGRQPLTPSEAAKRARGSLRKGMLLNLVGMGASLLGTYTIVGTLAAKALTQSAAVVGAAAPVQALDLLIVQANTNTLAAHFVGLCASLRLLRAASACEDLIDTA